MLRNSIKIIRADFFGDGMTKKVNLVSAVAVKVGLLCVQSGSSRFFSCFQSGLVIGLHDQKLRYIH